MNEGRQGGVTMESAAPRAETAPRDFGARRGTNQSGMRDNNERLVLSLVRQHGGEIRAPGCPGEGSAFRVDLPLERSEGKAVSD